jgi:hypothetical protein
MEIPNFFATRELYSPRGPPAAGGIEAGFVWNGKIDVVK